MRSAAASLQTINQHGGTKTRATTTRWLHPYLYIFLCLWFTGGGNNRLLAGCRNFLESPPAPEIKLTLITLHMWYRWLNPSLRCRPFSPSPSFYGVRHAHLMMFSDVNSEHTETNRVAPAATDLCHQNNSRMTTVTFTLPVGAPPSHMFTLSRRKASFPT